MVDAGQLRERVSLLTDTSASDGQGGAVLTTSTLATVWAEVRPMRAGEALQLREFIGATQGYTVTLRHRADVTPSMRLSWRPYGATAVKTLQIHSVQATVDRDALVLSCAEVI